MILQNEPNKGFMKCYYKHFVSIKQRLIHTFKSHTCLNVHVWNARTCDLHAIYRHHYIPRHLSTPGFATCMCPVVCPAVCPAVYPAMCPTVCPTVCPVVCPAVCPAMHVLLFV